MDELIRISDRIVSNTNSDFERYLLYEIEWEDRLIGLTGARGVGKTTLMLQYLKKHSKSSRSWIYVSLDNFYFLKNRLFDFAEEFYLKGGRHLFIDEVHHYPHWSMDIKNLHDIYHDLKIVFSGSSALQIHKAEADLSRRAAIYNLHELSFREYLMLSGKYEGKVYSFEEVLKNHTEISLEITKGKSIIPWFNEYLSEGIYPFFKEAKGQYHERLNSVINIIIERDLQVLEKISYATVYKLKMLVALLADNVPYQVNITALSSKTGLSRDVLLRLLGALDRANLIKNIRLVGSSDGYLTKPDKIYMNNTSLLSSLHSGNVSIKETMRETFFMNQMCKSHVVKSAKEGDFKIDNRYVFEIGGRKKTFEQIADLPDSFIAADDLEVGYHNKIPLWLFGFMY
ncbi:ATP-binding protein [Lentimicrobium sp. L6]|uniref:ATP-binding protein n=1 Tax=Lentimicrobium sp. L6 TaxID=2735916 RepID=UPI001554665C|nr:AAA family ATPase [Lentimicrobium sp. L6]NPD83660.1 ATP-binding protein [Lentimicrobium sp. L6]